VSLEQWLWHDRILLGACLVTGFLISYQLGVTVLQPRWLDPATDWLRAVLAWPELLLVGFVSLRLTRARHPAALAWWMLSIMLLAYAVAQNLWALFAQLIYSHGVPFPSLADLFYLLQYPCFFLAIILLPTTPSWGSRTKVAVDTLLWMGAVTALSWYFFLAPIYAQGGESPLGKLVSLAYPVGDLAVFFGLTMGLMRSSRGRADRLVLYVLVVAAGCLILADSWYAALLLSAKSVQAAAYAPNLVWIAAYLLVVLAGLVQLRLTAFDASPLPLTQAEFPQRGLRARRGVSDQQFQRDDLIASLPVLLPILAALLASVTIMIHAAMTYTDLQHVMGPAAVSLGLLLLAIGRQEIALLDYAQADRERETAQAGVLALREANRRKEAFLNIASHELKTPLASVRGNIQLLVRRLHAVQLQETGAEDLAPLVGQMHAALERSTVSLQRIGRLIDDLLDVACIGEGRLDLRQEPCDLASIVQQAVEAQRVIADARPFHVVLPATTPVVVLGDAERLGRVVTHYVTNAFKYSRADRPIVVSLQVADEVARLAVRDAGFGLPLEEQAHVWEGFYRASGVSVQSGSAVGLGLGLYICQTIIERHHGHVGVESEIGKGSTFWFTLPLVPSTS
jgi:signal transduction histidine kinase